MGVQLGYVSQMVTLLPGLAEQTSPLMLLLSTTPYRLFPLLYIAFTICNRRSRRILFVESLSPSVTVCNRRICNCRIRRISFVPPGCGLN